MIWKLGSKTDFLLRLHVCFVVFPSIISIIDSNAVHKHAQTESLSALLLFAKEVVIIAFMFN